MLAILFVAAALRFVGLDWGQGHLVHPDERRILMVVAEIHWPQPWDWSQVLGPRSSLNPRFFAYGSLPLYLLRLAGALVGLDPAPLSLAGRALSATYDLLTVVVVYAIGRELGGWRAGWLAAAFLACAVLAIQLAHFLTVDTLLTLLVALTVYCLVRVVQTGSLVAGALAGLCGGLALATKTSALPLIFTGWVAWALWTLKGPGAPDLARGAAGLALGATAGLLAFLFAQPYALIDWHRFGTAVVQEAAMARGVLDLPYTRQYIGTMPYLYHIRELALWSLGLPLGALALGGLLWFSGRAACQRRPEDLVLMAWFWPYFLVVGSFHAKFLRYMAPLVPWLCLMAALFFWRLWDLFGARRWPRCLVAMLGAGVLTLTLLYALAFVGLYLRPHPWVAASVWLREHVPDGAVLASEVWDDALPLGRPGQAEHSYEHLRLDLYAPDDEEKLDRLVEALGRADYVVLASQRLYATISRLPDRYPLTAAYYRLLFAERLGFRLVHIEASYPRLGPLAIANEPLAGTPLPRPALLAGWQPAPLTLCLGRADESFSVYDHPRVLIFGKEVALTPAQLRALLRAESAGRYSEIPEALPVEADLCYNRRGG